MTGSGPDGTWPPGTKTDQTQDARPATRGVSMLLLPEASDALDPKVPADDLAVWAEAAAQAVARAKAQLDVPQSWHVALVLGDDHRLRDLNLRHRKLDRPTDVLSFRVDPADLPPDEPRELGDVVISVPYARRSAAASGQALSAELALLAVHGLLHLLGHDDATEEGAARMRRLERQLGVRPPGDEPADAPSP